MYPGKPDIGALIAKEQEKQVGAMAISVCGTGGMSDDVRKGMRDRCEHTEIDFFEEVCKCPLCLPTRAYANFSLQAFTW